ncbi:unnamed protein product [Callosobruchus maculatus]|uniref:Serine/threonine-protein phosphatase 4 regulatory subunit 2 n=1 Tax=Callosobruchus maculatus TaxID=64391 RepID=A0A653DRJ4_CALMS|nr:unnamed protein product [Callosobruchus maculatus]
MDNPEEILHSLEEFSKMKPKDIPRELEEYLCYVARTGNPVYQWPTIKSLFREKLINVITEFYESCPSVEIPPCPNVEHFNYDLMKSFILEKLETFSSAPFTVQRICELLTTPRKEYNRIDKFMRALEKNILVVSTTEPGNGRRSTENGESLLNGEAEHLPENSNSSHDINVEEMDESPNWPRVVQPTPILYENNEAEAKNEPTQVQEQLPVPVQERANGDSHTEAVSTSEPPVNQQETVITCTSDDLVQSYVSIEATPVTVESSSEQSEKTKTKAETEPAVTIEPIPAESTVKMANGETGGSSEDESSEAVAEQTSETKKQDIPIEDQILATIPASKLAAAETTKEPEASEKSDTEAEKQSDVAQEAASTENVSPENSPSSPEVLQAETTAETEKKEPVEKRLEEPPKEPPSEDSEKQPKEKIEVMEKPKVEDEKPLSPKPEVKDVKDVGESEKQEVQKEKPAVKDEETDKEPEKTESDSPKPSEQMPMEVDANIETDNSETSSSSASSDDKL